ncbi:MAG TPA: biosynthetic-type acetolactate synthase large subunit [Ruminococcus sp.]|nr:biosynthetic-type acetolactate synthase large subunit [Ruminococcus flavefaciens]HRU96856.1 biosynthetic-type acetolactate synthase large subunit [Ruminococcus sp.]
MILSGADIVVRTLIEQGCDVVFGYPGGQIINVYDSLYKYRDELTHILTAHEQGASHAADGYARATGKVGVVIATSGPGATNLVTGIATAYLDSIPMVAITGNVFSSYIGSDSFQEIDITGITLPITKHNYVIGSVDELADTIREAFRLAVSGRPGPVLIDIPKDIQIAKCEHEPKAPCVPDERIHADDISIKEAAECISEAERPFIYFGGGLISSHAEDELMQLADLIDAPIGCSLMGISGVETDHPRFLGMQGMHGHYASSVAMHRADCIISLGVRFNDRVTGNREKFAKNAKIIHIDVDSSELSKIISPAYAIRGDVKYTVKKLIEYLAPVKHSQWWETIKGLRAEETAIMDKREGLTPLRVMEQLNRHLLPDTPVATDVGQHQMWAAQYLNFKKSRRFISSGGLGTMGFGIGAAIGAQIGTGKHTVLVTGDGSFGMCLQELATAVSYKIPLVILMLNNGVLGMVRQWQTLFFNEHYSNTVLDRKTDFVQLIKAFGSDGVRVNNIDELSPALEKAFSYDGPYLIECMIDKDEFVLPMLPPGGSMDDIIVKVGD